jgi:hypothetical protein
VKAFVVWTILRITSVSKWRRCKQGIPIIPILVQNALMPGAAYLPDDIRDLAFQNGMTLTPEFWQAGVERLIKELDQVMNS